MARKRKNINKPTEQQIEETGAQERARKPIDGRQSHAVALSQKPVDEAAQGAPVPARKPIDGGAQSASDPLRKPIDGVEQSASDPLRKPIDGVEQSAPASLPRHAEEATPQRSAEPESDGEEAYRKYAKQKAKSDLEWRVAQKLTTMSETDLEELFLMYAQRQRAKKEIEKAVLFREPFSKKRKAQQAAAAAAAQEYAESVALESEYAAPTPPTEATPAASTQEFDGEAAHTAAQETAASEAFEPEYAAPEAFEVVPEPEVVAPEQDAAEPAPPMATVPVAPMAAESTPPMAAIEKMDLQARVEEFYKGFDESVQEPDGEPMDFAEKAALRRDALLANATKAAETFAARAYNRTVRVAASVSGVVQKAYAAARGAADTAAVSAARRAIRKESGDSAAAGQAPEKKMRQLLSGADKEKALAAAPALSGAAVLAQQEKPGTLALRIAYGQAALIERTKPILSFFALVAHYGGIWIRKRLERIALFFQKQTKARTLVLRGSGRLIKAEQHLSGCAASLITGMDRRSDKMAEKATRIVIKSGWRINFAREWADLHKRTLVTFLLVVLSLSISAATMVNSVTAYEYKYNNRTLGMVKHQEDVLTILELVSEQLTREYGAEVNIDEERDIEFQRVLSFDGETDDVHDVLNKLTYMQNMSVRAYGLYIDGRRVAVLDSEERAEQLLQSLKDLYTGRPENAMIVFEEVDFAEEIEVTPFDTQLGRIENADIVMERILTGAVQEQVHVVQPGETFYEIARLYGMSQAELEQTNPGINPSRLSIGQEIILTQAVPLATVQTVEVLTYIEPIPFETLYEDNANIFRGEQSTKVQGVNGEREVTARITKNNGIEVGKEELEATVLRGASAAVVMVGIKEPPPLQGTGSFIHPAPGSRLSSRFGMRGGRMHQGVDLSAPAGTPIRAADGGTVTFAGYQGGYGYVIIINHGGNMETLYAHCSRLHVSRGTRVYQGQHIANVGSTGRSTGNHLHFEVRVNGVARNPLNYI